MADMTDQYNTKLSKGDEEKFQSWAADNGRTGDLENYDMRGWWKKNGKADAEAQGDARGHFTDEFKKPNHPTFSDESKYHGVDDNKGGTWGTKAGKDTFTPSETNLKNMTPEELKAYFSKVEPEADLILPEPAPGAPAAPAAPAAPQSRADRWYGGS